MNMTRTDFLKSLGLSGTALLTVLMACQKTVVTPDTPVDFDLDLNDRANVPLRQPGGFVVVNGVVVARSGRIPFPLVAVTQTCSHQELREVVFQGNEFVCLAHGARFDTAGKGLNAYGSQGLRVYNIEQTGSMIRVRS
jgi:cytochrome b6-f complex iron-sulfur subunit